MTDPFNPWDFFAQKGNKFPEKWNSPDLSWVSEYINDIMKQALPTQFQTGQTENRESRETSDVTSDVFETHHFMITRVEVPDDIFPENIKVMFHINELYIEGISPQPLHIKLPSNGLYKGSKAHFKDHILEIRIPKRGKGREQEIPIQT
ncbi:MAG TPA: Hsp20/alpha crystallin family protein [Bacillales bacterium]|nr:Hsp20/alpha crystallin family protein [Bacillales bacterium]